MIKNLKLKNNKIIIEKRDELIIGLGDITALYDSLLNQKLQMLQQLNYIEFDLKKIEKFAVDNHINLNQKTIKGR